MSDLVKVLYVDDNFIARKKFAEALATESYGARFQLELASNAHEFVSRLPNFKPDVVVLDIQLSGDAIDGLGLLEQVKSQRPRAAVFMCSNLEDVATIRSCLELGADDYIAKSYDSGTLALRLLKGFQFKKLQYFSPEHARQTSVYAGQTMQKIAARVESLVTSAVTAVHIQGESGTGKEVVASMIGEFEKDRPFIRVNCGAINPSLLESELFGHVKGAFTGADRDRKGFIQAASQGWLFLDEIASLSASAQVALLRVLETNEVIPLGSHVPQKIQVRVISASNEPLAGLVAAGRFRKDLWQRLVETEILLPALRQRKDEIPDLVQLFCRTMTGGPYRIDPTAIKVLQDYDWTDGNVRELRNCLRAMTEFHVNKELTLLSLPARILKRESMPAKTQGPVLPNQDVALSISLSSTDSLPFHFETLTDRMLAACVYHLLKKTPGLTIRSLAEQLAIPKTTLARKLKLLEQKGLFHGTAIHE